MKQNSIGNIRTSIKHAFGQDETGIKKEHWIMVSICYLMLEEEIL